MFIPICRDDGTSDGLLKHFFKLLQSHQQHITLLTVNPIEVAAVAFLGYRKLASLIG